VPDTTAVEVLETALKDEPTVKTAIVGLIQKIETLGADATKAIAAEGLDVPDDVLTAQAAQTLFEYVKETFLPAIESAYKDEASILEAGAATSLQVEAASSSSPDSATDESTIVQQGPGLHTVAATA